MSAGRANERTGTASSSPTHAPIFAGLDAAGRSGPSSPTGLSSSEIISMIKKGNGTGGGGIGGVGIRNVVGNTLDSPKATISTKTESFSPTASSDSIKAKMAFFVDDYKMEGLAEIIRRAHGDKGSVALGIDSEAIITALGAMSPTSTIQDGNDSKVMLSKVVTSPWVDPIIAVGGGKFGTGNTGSSNSKGTGASSNSLESILPACYNVQAPPPAATRISAFTEETLFYMFYGMPKDRMQEMAARELTVSRGWRFHKELSLWIVPSSATPTTSSMTAGISALRLSPAPPSASPLSSTIKSPISTNPVTPSSFDDTAASYIVFDPNTWSKVRRELALIKPEHFEDRFLTGSAYQTR